MASNAYMLYPATSIKMGLENVLYSISRFIIKKFPHTSFKYIVIDTQDKMKDFYKQLTKDREVGEKIQEIRKIPRPHLYIGYTFNNFNTDDTGLGIHPLQIYPSQFFDNTLQMYQPIFHDKERDIEIRTSNVRIRVESEVVITCQSKEEQVTLYTYLINFIKILYGYRISGIKTEYILPASLIRSIKNIIYGEKTKIEDVSKSLDDYLKIHSAGGINPRYRNGKKEDKFYALEYNYDIVYFQLSNKPEMDGGERKDDVYDNYLIRFPMFIEVYVPINYVVKTPELVAGINSVSQIGDFIFMSNVPDENAEGQIMKIIKEYNDTLKRSYIDKNIYKLIYRDDFLLSSPVDIIDIPNWLPKEDKEIYDMCTIDERKSLFKVFFFEDNYLLDKNYVTIDDNFIATITNGNITSTQTIEIYRNEEEVIKIKNKYLFT